MKVIRINRSTFIPARNGATGFPPTMVTCRPKGVFAMDEEGVQKNIDAPGQIGIKATREMFDTTLLDEV